MQKNNACNSIDDMWLFFALLAPSLFAAVHVLDSYCVDHILEKPWMGVVTSSITSIIVVLTIPFLLPVINWDMPSFPIVLAGIGAGVLIQMSQVFYFKALSYSEAGIVAAYWNFIPALLPLASFIIFREVLSGREYAGITILIVSSTALCLIDYYNQTRFYTFALMLFASALQVAAYLLMNYIYGGVHYFIGFLLVTIGLILTGIVPLFFSKVRLLFIRNIKKLKSAAGIFIGIEIVNLLALASAQMAISLGNPSLVAAAETTMPAYTFLFSLIFFFFAKKYHDIAISHHLHYKMAIVVLMVGGVFLIA